MGLLNLLLGIKEDKKFKTRDQLLKEKLFNEECKILGLTKDEIEECKKSGISPEEWAEENDPNYEN